MTDIFAGYGRISRIGRRDVEHLHSDRNQESEVRAAGASRGLAVPRVFFDYDESGAKLERPRLIEAIEAIERGEYAGLIVARLDRLSRDSRHMWELAERIYDAGGRIYSFAENADFLTPDGELQIGIIASFARYQRRVLADAFKKAKRTAVENGVPVTTRMAPGLKVIHAVNAEGRRRRVGVEHDEDVADVIAEFFARRVKGWGPARLGEFLTINGVRTSMGSAAWSKQAVYGLLRNRAFLGELHNGDFVKLDAWPAIVDEATFLAAQRPVQVQVQRSRADRGDDMPDDLLVGIGRCASCRHALNANWDKKVRVYRCTVDHAGGRCPAPARMHAAELEALVLAAFWSMVPEHHAEASGNDDTLLIDELRRRAERSQRKFEIHRDDPSLDETIEALGGMPQWRAWLRRHRETAEADQAALGHALAQQTTPDLPPETELRAEWDTMPRDTRRDHLAKLIDMVALLPRSSGLPADRRVVVFASGSGPTDVPRRGYRDRATLRPFDLPTGVGVGAFEPGDELVSETPVTVLRR